MVWAPNTGVGYPFNGAGQYLPANADDARFKQMDTNHDGKLDSLDDSFAPYYPGDDVVDWIGISLYSKVWLLVLLGGWALSCWLTGGGVKRDNGKPDKDSNLVASRATLKTFISNPNGNFNVYQEYSVSKKKPFMIAETAAAYYPEFAEGDGEVAIKRNWWGQFWSDDTMTTYPLLKVLSPGITSFSCIANRPGSLTIRRWYGSNTTSGPKPAKTETTPSRTTSRCSTPFWPTWPRRTRSPSWTAASGP